METLSTLWLRQSSAANKELANLLHRNQVTSICLSFLCPCSVQKVFQLNINLGQPEVRAGVQSESTKAWPLYLSLNFSYRINTKQHHRENGWLSFHWKTTLITFALGNIYGELVKSTVLHGQGHIDQERYSESWGLSRSLRLPELPLLPCKTRMILNLAEFGNGTKEVFLWVVPGTQSERIHGSSPPSSHPALNCFNLITPLSQSQIIEHHLRDYKVR